MLAVVSGNASAGLLLLEVEFCLRPMTQHVSVLMSDGLKHLPVPTTLVAASTTHLAGVDKGQECLESRRRYWELDSLTKTNIQCLLRKV